MNNLSREFELLLGHAAFKLWPDLPRDMQEKLFRRGLSNAQVKFLDENQALTVQMINSLRDAAQHHILNISEPHLAVLGTR